VIADLDTLLIALYVELTDRVIPASGLRHRGPGRPPQVTDAELVCLAVAQVLLRYHDERHWLRAAPGRVGHLFPRLLSQSEYNERLKGVAPLMEAALRWLAAQTPGSVELLRLLDGTPVGCGQSTITVERSGLFGYAGYGYEPSHSRYYWGVKLLLICTADGTVTGFGLANPKLVGEREAVRQLLRAQPANRPPLGSAVVTDKGLAGEETEEFFAGLGLALVRPARKDEHDVGLFPNWLRQRVEAIIWTLKHQLGLEAHGGRVPGGLWTRIVQRLLALNAVIWHNWAIGAPVKRSLIAYDHCDDPRGGRGEGLTLDSAGWVPCS
jgi:Transposase DDE domain